MPGLGGLRHPRADSPNTGWLNASFRGFADYMETQEFQENLEALNQLAGKERLALMCAEALPWRCHRSLIADALGARGILVEHILSLPRRQPHALTPWAQVKRWFWDCCGRNPDALPKIRAHQVFATPFTIHHPAPFYHLHHHMMHGPGRIQSHLPQHPSCTTLLFQAPVSRSFCDVPESCSKVLLSVHCEKIRMLFAGSTSAAE
jgi:hypothetical protein